MALIRWDPFAELNSLHDQLNNLFNDNLGPARSMQLAPVTDVYREDDKHLMVDIHLPNFKEAEIDINVRDHTLEVKAEHQEKTEDKKKRQYMVRESSTSFYRRIALPREADESKVKANFENGILTITVPFKELPQPTRIAIGSGKKADKDKKK